MVDVAIVIVPYAGQLVLQILYAVMNIIVKIALDRGMNHYVLVTYRHVIATIAIFPIAYFVERNQRPPLTTKAAIHIFLLSLCGITVNQNLLFSGLEYTSAVFVSAADNLIPVITFFMALFLGMEHVDLKKRRGQAKVFGTAICVGGAMILTFYKGTSLLHMITTQLRLMSSMQLEDSYQIGSSSSWFLGAIMVYISQLAWAGWLIYQAWFLKFYPAPLSLTALMCLFGALQCALVALLFDFDLSSWKLQWNMALASYLYTGVACSALGYFIQGWCIKKKDAVFSAAFSPLSTVVVVILQILFINQPLYIGSLYGGVMVIGGLYCVLWGKAKDGEYQNVVGFESAAAGVDATENNGSSLGNREPLLSDE